MKQILDDLWYSYLIDSPMEQSNESRKISDRLLIEEEALHASLNAEQMDMLKKYEDLSDDLQCISEKEAFIKGIRFAVKFFMEALYKN